MLLHEKLAKLKGCIRVCARMRPIIPEDGKKSAVFEVTRTNNVTMLQEGKSAEKYFLFDKAFGPES